MIFLWTALAAAIAMTPPPAVIAMTPPVAAPLAAPLTGPAAITPRTPCPPASTNKFVDPPNLYSTNGVLDVTLTLSQQVRNHTPVLCWVYPVTVNGKTTLQNVPPTLNVRQGEKLSITLVNTLYPPSGNIETPPPIGIDREAAPPARGTAMNGMALNGMAMNGASNPYALMCGQPQLAPTPTPDPVTGRIYGYHRSPWNEANLHFHGLNTSPSQPSDDVVNVLLCPRPAGSTQAPAAYHYIVGIPRDEPPGTYWYHPHAHGESLYQVFEGLTGAIVVHSLVPSVPDRLTDRMAIVRDSPALAGVLKYPAHAALMRSQPNFAEIRAQFTGAGSDFKRRPGNDPFQPPDTCPGPPIPYNTTSLTVNGVSLPLNGNVVSGLPETTIGLGETQYWRLANTDAQTSLDLHLLVDGKQQPLMVTARDGVPLVVVNGRPTYRPVPMDHVFLPPASRIEFYLTGATAGAHMVIRTGEINTGCVGDVDLARNLFDVRVGTTRVAARTIVPGPLDPVPERFADLGAQTPAVKRTFVFTEYARTDEPEPDFYITEISNPKAVEHPYRMTGPPDTVVKDGTVEEWTIYNYTNEIHGFHIHQIHFMPIAGATIATGLGQLVDTVLVPHGGYDSKGTFQPRAVKVLMDFRARNIVGTFVYHCHFLEHEDNGMMARIRVDP